MKGSSKPFAAVGRNHDALYAVVGNARIIGFVRLETLAVKGYQACIEGGYPSGLLRVKG